MGRYNLVHEFGNVIHSGSARDCELIHKAFAKYGGDMYERKFDVKVNEDEKFLTDDTRSEIVNYLVDGYYDHNCGSSCVKDMIVNGTPSFDDLSDLELLDELEQIVDPGDDGDEVGISLIKLAYEQKQNKVVHTEVLGGE